MATRLAVATRQIFPTTVAALEVPDAPALNAQFRETILRRRAEYPSVRASNAGGWHSERDLPEWGGAAAAKVLAMAQAVASQLTTDRRGQARPVLWRVTAWANVNGPGDANICHYHPGSFWSGTYYVADGGAASDPALGGEFEMLDPRGPAPSMFAPTLAVAGEGGLAMGATETIRPRPGLLFLFPSWLMHQVRPYRGSGERISVAFNLAPRIGEEPGPGAP